MVASGKKRRASYTSTMGGVTIGALLEDAVKDCENGEAQRVRERWASPPKG